MAWILTRKDLPTTTTEQTRETSAIALAVAAATKSKRQLYASTDDGLPILDAGLKLVENRRIGRPSSVAQAIDYCHSLSQNVTNKYVRVVRHVKVVRAQDGPEEVR